MVRVQVHGVKEHMHDPEEVLPRQQPFVTRGEVVRRLRGVKGWSQEKLGERAGGMSRNTVRDAESDLPTVTGETWGKIAGAFGLEPEDLDVQTHGEGADLRLVEAAYDLLHRALFPRSTVPPEGSDLTEAEKTRIARLKTEPRPRDDAQEG